MLGGRYYKYELAGSPFEEFVDESGLSGFKNILPYNNEIQWDILKKIDAEHNVKGGNLLIGEWGDYSPSREDVVRAFDFDDRGGRCLVIYKSNETFEIKDIECDSPE